MNWKFHLAATGVTYSNCLFHLVFRLVHRLVIEFDQGDDVGCPQLSVDSFHGNFEYCEVFGLFIRSIRLFDKVLNLFSKFITLFLPVKTLKIGVLKHHFVN